MIKSLNRLSFLKFITTIILISSLISGCSVNQNDTASPTSSSIIDGNTITIATTFYPIFLFTSNIVQGIPNVNVINMTDSTAGCLHDYALTTKDLKTIENAQILVTHGAGAENFLEKVIEQRPDLKIITASEGIELIEGSHSHGHDHKEDDHGHGQGHEHEHNANPHIWVSPSNAILEVQNICEQLSELDPDNAIKYQENAAKTIEKLETLKSKMHSTLDTISDKNIVVFHDSFPYFAKEFDLNIVRVVEGEEGSEPSARELSETIQIVKENNVKAIFIEPQYSSKTADVIAQETGARVYTIDPVVTGPMDDPDAYFKKMEENLKILEEALR